VTATQKTEERIPITRVERSTKYRFNPLPNLTPETLTTYHDQFRRGYLRGAALLWDEIEDTDDVLKVVAPKTKKAVARHGWEIITVEDSPKAQAHKKTLEYFYNSLSASSVLDLDERGGMPLLVRQMMDAYGKRYAVHEIIWRPTPDGLTAEFRQAPLWFFERTSGRLRYLKDDTALTGEDLEEGGWLVTVGDGIMRACAVAYLYKHLPLQDWLIFSERFGQPAIKGESDGKPGDDAWEAMEEAVTDLAGGDSVVISAGSDITPIDFSMSGTLPYAELVDRMDRALATLWRGSDLSTLSRDSGTGASLQADESEILETDHASNITDTLNEQVDRWVIKYQHGDAQPLAWLRIKTAVKEDLATDLKIDKGLDEMGYADELTALQKRYNRPTLRLAPEGVAPSTPSTSQPSTSAANESPSDDGATPALLDEARRLFAEATAADLAPIRDRLAQILEDTPDEALANELEIFRSQELPELAREILAYPATAGILENTQAAALLNGWAATAAQHAGVIS